MVKSEAPQVGYMLKRAQAILHARMEEALAPFGLTTAHYSCLEQLRRQPGISAADLARASFVTRQSMNTLLQSLQDRGLVERPQRPESGRALPTVLTDAGALALGKAQASVDAVEARMLSSLSETEAAALARSLASCAASLDA